MLSSVLFGFYFLICLWLIHIIVKKKRISLSFWQTTLIFSFKVLLGCIYGYIFLHYYGGDDTWAFYNDSLPLYNTLLRHPAHFFDDMLPGFAQEGTHSAVHAVGFYHNHLEYLIMTRLMAVLNIFSNRNYYIDVLLFNFLVCWGPLLMHRLCILYFPEKKRIFFFALFLIPSISFWLSGIRAEGPLLLCMAAMLYYGDRWIRTRKWPALVWIAVGMLGFLILRLSFFIIFLPAYIAFGIALIKKRRALTLFIGMYAAVALLFLLSMLVFPDKNLSTPIVRTQEQFFLLHGNTRYSLDTLQPTIASFASATPGAFVNSFLRPYPWEAKGILQQLSATESIAFLVFLVFYFVNRKAGWQKRFDHPFILLLIFYGFTQILAIGYIVPFPGALVRYKTIAELFLILGII